MTTTQIDAQLRHRLFFMACMSLILTSMTFAFRASLESTWGSEFGLSKMELGWIFGPAFWGFTIAMILGGFLYELLGTKNILFLALSGHILGIITYLVSSSPSALFIGTVFIGIGNGMVEAACNPLVVALFPERKTAMLNRFHVWFPGGIVIGGLLAFLFIDVLALNWRVLLSLLFIPALIYGFMLFKLDIPAFSNTTFTKFNVFKKQILAVIQSPLFLIMLFCMLLSAATELGTNQWMNALLSGSGISGILILVFINGLMAFGRFFAGGFIHQFSSILVLLFSSIISGVGLVLLSYSTGYTSFFAAFIFALGICFFWPTMLGFIAENVHTTGAIGLSLMGGSGMFSVSFILPAIGHWYDEYKQVALQKGIPTMSADSVAGSQTFLDIALMPLVLTIIFTGIFIWQRYTNSIKTTTHKS